MAFRDLPPKYYLDHFFELIDFIEDHSKHLLEQNHLDFINDFKSLSEDAQCVYVRMLNRKGNFFKSSEFKKYQEIENLDQAFSELFERDFVRTPQISDRSKIASHLTKPQLLQWMTSCGIKVKKSLSRENLISAADSEIKLLDLSKLALAPKIIVQERIMELEYLFFIYFGELTQTLNLYTLRDLGVRKSNTRTSFRSRFQSLELAKREYDFLKLKQSSLSSHELYDQLMSLEPLRYSQEKIQAEILMTIADGTDDLDLKILSLKKTQIPPARERLCRIYYSHDQKDSAFELIEKMIESPLNDEELLFAEDFMMRKFKKQKIGSLTETLRSAEKVTLSDFYFRKPERGVKDYLKKEKNLEAAFSENYLWNGLFGILFWDLLFEADSSSIFNPFERTPYDLVGKDFYNKQPEQIEQRLALLEDKKRFEIFILKVISQHYGKNNDVFTWHPNLGKLIINFLRNIKDQDLAHVLRVMAKDYQFNHSGFPDLVIYTEFGPCFLEVKAEGDSLRNKQLSKFRLLQSAGFKVDVLRVDWEKDPNQSYVVVDIETTGGTSQHHRITEIAALKVIDGKIVDKFQTLIHPGRPIPRFITQLTGISDEMVADAPRFSEIADQFDEFTEGSIFVAHNARFDYGFIQREFMRLQKEYTRPTMCTVVSSRRTFPGLPSYSLKNLSAHFGISLENHHRALSDATATAELFILIQGFKETDRNAKSISEKL